MEKLKAIKNILVALDLSEMDDQLIRYTGFIAKNTSSTKIYFINVVRNFEMPKELEERFGELVQPPDEQVIAEMKKRVAANFPEDFAGQVHYEVNDGSATEKISKWAKVKDIDLIVAGRKKNLMGSGLLPSKLAREVACNLLILPEGVKLEFNSILVPIDNTEHSAYALSYAFFLANRTPWDVNLICQNIYTVPVGYRKTGKTYKEFAAIMRGLSEKNFHKIHELVKDEMTETDIIYTLDRDDHPVPDILKTAKSRKVDMIIIGAKAISKRRAFFMRNVAEKLVKLDENVPLLIVRPKGQKEGIRQAVKKM